MKSKIHTLVLSVSFLANCLAFKEILHTRRNVLQVGLQKIEYQKAYEQLSRTLGRKGDSAFTCKFKAKGK